MLKINLLDDIEFDYINWKGEFGKREIKVWNIYFGSTEFHGEEQWLLEGWDYHKQVVRVFAMKDMSNIIVISGE